MNFVFEKYLISAIATFTYHIRCYNTNSKRKERYNENYVFNQMCLVVDVGTLTGICIYMCMNDFILITVIYNMSYLYGYIQRFYTDGGKKFSKLKHTEQ